MKIFFDLDDILIDFVPEWIKEINRLYFLHKTMDDIKYFSMEKNYHEEIKKGLLTSDDMWKIFDNKKFWDQIKPIDGMDKVIDLAKKENEIGCLTSSCYRDCGLKLEKTLFKYYPDFNWNNTVILMNKGSVLGDILVDDNYYNIISFLKTNKHAHGFLRVTNYVPWQELYENKDVYGKITLFNDSIDLLDKLDSKLYEVKNRNNSQFVVGYSQGLQQYSGTDKLNSTICDKLQY